MSKDHVCPPDRAARCYIALVVEPDNCDVLVLKQGSKVTFPRVNSPEIPHRGRHMSDCFSYALERLTGTRYDLVFLYSSINETHHSHLRGIPSAMFECVGPLQKGINEPVDPQSDAYKWMSISGLGDSIVAGTLKYGQKFDVYGRLDLLRADRKCSEKGLRPWEEPGWFKSTAELAASALADLNYDVTTTFEQHQISPAAAVLRAGTTKGRVYLKASTKREALTMQCASSFAPFLVRKPLYVNVQREWMLMEDYGPTLYERFSREDFENIVILHGKLQVESVEHISELINAGIPKQGPEPIMNRTQRMLDDPGIREIYANVRDGAPPDDGAEPDLTKCCETVSSFLKHIYTAYRVPLALVHGDLYDDNVIKTNGEAGSYVVYDWASARIDIPFSDVMFLETEVTPRDERRKEGIDRYLELWAEYGSLSELRKLCEYVSAKDDLLTLLDSYEYAVDKFVLPRLDDTNVTHLYNTLLSIQKAMS